MLYYLPENGQLQAVCRRVVASGATFLHGASLHIEKFVERRVIKPSNGAVLCEVLDKHQSADSVLIVWLCDGNRPETCFHLFNEKTLPLRDSELATRTAENSESHHLGAHRHYRTCRYLVKFKSLALRNFLSHEVPREPRHDKLLMEKLNLLNKDLEFLYRQVVKMLEEHPRVGHSSAIQ